MSKQYQLQLTERGDKRSFETRAFIEIEANSLVELFNKLLIEMSKVFATKVEEAYIKGREEVIHDNDMPF